MKKSGEFADINWFVRSSRVSNSNWSNTKKLARMDKGSKTEGETLFN
ncbi:MAG: hypothetical protein ISS17_00380 [Bacteroidales bacterium]|nr:hypothetical protein [Bacteroidales bacterium]